MQKIPCFVIIATHKMNEYPSLRNYLNKYIPVNQEEEDFFINKFSIKKIVRRQVILEPGQVARYRNYVLNGALRAYVLGEDGEDHTISFAIEDWWITDYQSFIFQQPATQYVVALEDTTLLQLSFEDEEVLKTHNPKYETFFRKHAERALAFRSRRIVTNLTQNAEDRYLDFLKNYPKVVLKVPQYALASYLGMTSEFLSKIRHRQLLKRT